MRRRTYIRLYFVLFVLLVSSTASAQERQLERSFSVGAPHVYRVRLTLRSELEGQRAVSTGASAYAEHFSRSAEVTLSWRATSRVTAVAEDGAAQIEEALAEFDVGQFRADPATDDEAKKLSAALADVAQRWSVPRTLHYRETPAGQLSTLPPEGVPALGEEAPPLLTLWLLRALRPAVTLPGKPIVFGERWEQPRSAKLDNWMNVRGIESGEWLDAGGAEPAVRLHVVQQISGSVASGADRPEASAAQASFHAESLTTLALLDGRVLAADRSAVREIVRTLDAVPGLTEPPRFRARLSVQVQIEDCNDNPCRSVL